MLRYAGYMGILMFACCYITGGGDGVPGVSTVSLFFWGGGAYVAIKDLDVFGLTKQKYIIWFGAIFLLIICTIYNGHNTPKGEFIYPFFVIIGSLAVLILFIILTQKYGLHIPLFFQRSSFFVYLSHIFFLGPCTSAVLRIIGYDNVIAQTIGYMITPFIVITICLSIFYYLNKITPQVLNGIMGGR